METFPHFGFYPGPRLSPSPRRNGDRVGPLYGEIIGLSPPQSYPEQGGVTDLIRALQRVHEKKGGTFVLAAEAAHARLPGALPPARVAYSSETV
jgi:mannose-6-phosphate isomerase class I